MMREFWKVKDFPQRFCIFMLRKNLCMNTIEKKLKQVEKRIQKACDKSGRNREDVKLLLATKTVEPDRIIKALDAGYKLIAENKIQELRNKYEALKTYHPHHHFIGHLQSNKVKFLTRYNVELLHSLDRKKVALKLQNRLEFEDKEMNVLLQVNTSLENSKFGIHPDKALDFAEYVAHFNRIHIKGLMTIGLFSAEKEKVVPCFRLLRKLKEEIEDRKIKGVEMKELSMGMTHDLEWAIAEGATIVRVGTAIFGERPYPDSYYWNEG